MYSGVYYSGNSYSLAVDPDGNAVFAWTTADGILARVRRADGTWSGVETLSPDGQAAAGPNVAVNANGDAVFAWRRHDASNCGHIQARARSADGTLCAVQRLSRIGGCNRFPKVAVEANGRAIFAWDHEDHAGYAVHAWARAADGVLGEVEPLASSATHAVFGVWLAADVTGNAVFAWSNYGTGARVKTRARAAQ